MLIKNTRRNFRRGISAANVVPRIQPDDNRWSGIPIERKRSRQSGGLSRGFLDCCSAAELAIITRPLLYHNISSRNRIAITNIIITPPRRSTRSRTLDRLPKVDPSLRDDTSTIRPVFNGTLSFFSSSPWESSGH